MRQRRSLSREEAALWAAVAGTVRPMPGKKALEPLELARSDADPVAKPRKQLAPGRTPAIAPTPPKAGPAQRPAPRSLGSNTLDATWDKKLARAVLSPDFTLDLHGHSLSAAHARLDAGLGQAAMMGARLVLVITGRPRPAEAADRGERRGAIRAKVLDWLALGPHASRIAAVRPAHRRHGGAGALYVVLRRPG